ncbi:NAD-dependent epimerase/dehydratase family protein [Flavobacteriaceae bacterium]|nr:NAD-dependent epimerase/dehydratase family protein [Flavobacteriaceae bacterium]
MINKKYKIAISSIGSGIGQSIINAIRLSNLPIRTIGFGNNPFAFGAYDCDEFDHLPSIYSGEYIDDLIKKCKIHKIDLLIPGLDDEVLILARNKIKLKSNGINAMFADEALVAICRNKELISTELNKTTDIFVKSFNKKSLQSDIEKGRTSYPLLAKPKDGFSSKGIIIIRSKEDLLKVSDVHVIQELAIPSRDDPNFDFYMQQISMGNNPQVSEISIQLVFSPKGQLMGKMCSFNKLKNGIPIEIIPFENDDVWKTVDELIPVFRDKGVKGPLNLQGRLTEKGLKLFELNPRFTGITGLRALQGFNEVEACVKEWLGINTGQNKLKLNYNRFGVRQTTDKSIPIERNDDVFSLHKKLNKKIKTKKTLFITGSTGYLGQNLIKKLIETDDFDLITYGLNKSKVENLFKGKVKAIYDYKDLKQGVINLGNVDLLLHLGFRRPFGENKQVADSLRFTNKLFTLAAQNQLPAVINISSQSVYGLSSPPLWTEQTPVAPETVYAQAKYATELMLASAHKLCNTLCFSSIRLGTLTGGANGLIGNEVISIFCKNALDGKKINIIGGMQELERFDIKDAVDALIAMIKTDSKKMETGL